MGRSIDSCKYKRNLSGKMNDTCISEWIKFKLNEI